MYIMKSFLNGSFLGIKWNSRIHKTVAENCLLCNPSIVSKDRLVECATIINGIPKEKIQKVTLGDLVELGIPCNG